jgi:hypothetical protein
MFPKKMLVVLIAPLNELQLSVLQQKLKLTLDVTQALEQANVSVAAFGANPFPNKAVTFELLYHY